MIPVALTTVFVETQAEPEPGEGLTFGPALAFDVRAVISSPTGSEVPGPGGGSERIDAVLLADPIPGLSHTDVLTDGDGSVYQVVWVAQRGGLGLDHTAAGLVKKTSRTPGG